MNNEIGAMINGVVEWWREEPIERPTFNIQLPRSKEQRNWSYDKWSGGVLEYWSSGVLE